MSHIYPEINNVEKMFALEQWFLILTAYHTGSFKKNKQTLFSESHPPTDSQLILEQYLFERCGSTYMFSPQY